MNRFNFLIILFLFFLSVSDITVACSYNSRIVVFEFTPQDTIHDTQLIFNGRIWQNLFYMVDGDQFLFFREFLPGSMTIRGKSVPHILLKYDIYNDEILTPLDSGGVLQLNKEMIDSFSLFYQNKSYKFIRLPEDSLKVLEGYANEIYRGKTALEVKYRKKIDRPKIEGSRDYFYQVSHIYLVKDGIFHEVGSRSDLFKVLDSDKAKIKDFMKKNKLKISKNMPESFVPVIRYYDTLSQ